MTDNQRRLAGHVYVPHGEIYIDGEWFPWHIAEPGPSATYDFDDLPTVWIPVLAESVTFDRTRHSGGDQ